MKIFKKQFVFLCFLRNLTFSFLDLLWTIFGRVLGPIFETLGPILGASWAIFAPQSSQKSSQKMTRFPAAYLKPKVPKDAQRPLTNQERTLKTFRSDFDSTFLPFWTTPILFWRSRLHGVLVFTFWPSRHKSQKDPAYIEPPHFLQPIPQGGAILSKDIVQ